MSVAVDVSQGTPPFGKTTADADRLCLPFAVGEPLEQRRECLLCFLDTSRFNLTLCEFEERLVGAASRICLRHRLEVCRGAASIRMC